MIEKKKNGCSGVREQLAKALKMKKIWMAIGIIAIVGGSLGIMAIALFGSVENPFEDRYDEGYADGFADGSLDIDPTFQLNISIADFYIMDNQTLEKNFSYYLHSFQVDGIRFRSDEWNISKDLNGSDWGMYAQNNAYFMEQSIFAILDSSFNSSISVDNTEFITRHLPTLIIADYEFSIYNNDTTLFSEDPMFSSVVWEFMNQDIAWSDYPYKSIERTQNIDIKILGCVYDFTNYGFDRLFIEFNGIEREIKAI